jgi:LPS sulfotransferase NodH
LTSLIIPPNKSVIIFSSYRTGSTALCDYFAKEYGLGNFDEVFHECVPIRTENFKKFIKSNGNFVIKIMPDQINDSNIDFVNQLAANSFLIKLSRKNIVKQITSLYLCYKTDQWHFKKTDNSQPYTVPINPEHFENTIEYILKNNSALDMFDYLYDLKLYYEDLATVDTQYAVYHKPSNYQDLVNAIEEKLKDYE